MKGTQSSIKIGFIVGTGSLEKEGQTKVPNMTYGA